MEIREYDPKRDRAAVRACFVELQDVERKLRPGNPPGEKIADAYLEVMFRRGREFAGMVLVAIDADAVVGFISVWTRHRSFEPDDDPTEHGYVSDLVVSETSRGRGIGRALLRAAETKARQAGARTIGLTVLAGNGPAESLYAAEGFAPTQISLEKRLD